MINPLKPWGDSIDTVKHCLPLDEWYRDYPQLPYSFFRLPSQYSFDIDRMNHEIDKLLQKHNTISIARNSHGKRYNRYKGLGFLSRKDAANPLEDHFTRRDENIGEVYSDNLYQNGSLPALYENDFTKPTEIYNDYFQQVFSVFKSSISKASILDLRSKGHLSSHVDFPYYKTIRLHATIRGGENAWYEIAGERFQIPADGNWYFIDTGKYHSVWNEGPDDRLTINVNLIINGDPLELAEQGLL